MLVRAFGNGFTPQAAVEDYVLLKAAEVTLAAGKQCFEIVSRGAQTMPSTTVTAYGNFTYDFPAARLRIRLTDALAPCGEGDAKAVAEHLRTKVMDKQAYFPKPTAVK